MRGRAGLDPAVRLVDVGLAVKFGALDADAGEELRKESGRPATAVAERLGGSGRRKSGEICLDIVDSEADVMQPFAVDLEPAIDRGVCLKGLNELHVRIAGVEIGETDSQALDVLRGDHLEAESVAKLAKRCLRVANGDGDMIEPPDHRMVYPPSITS
jgi:hypothetical protein